MEFKIDDMTCNHCVETISGAVVAIDASADLKFDVQSRQVKIESRASRDAVREAIERAGYSVREDNIEQSRSTKKTGCCCAPRS